MTNDPEVGPACPLDTVETPLNALDEQALCRGTAALDKVNASLR